MDLKCRRVSRFLSQNPFVAQPSTSPQYTGSGNRPRISQRVLRLRISSKTQNPPKP